MWWVFGILYAQAVAGTWLGILYQNHVQRKNGRDDRTIPWYVVIVLALIPAFTLPLVILSLEAED